jgi:hypothetical protein
MENELWRRRRDSNPRDPFGSNGFQDRRFQPLTHSSVSKYNLRPILANEWVTLWDPIAAIENPVKHSSSVALLVPADSIRFTELYLPRIPKRNALQEREAAQICSASSLFLTKVLNNTIIIFYYKVLFDCVRMRFLFQINICNRVRRSLPARHTKPFPMCTYKNTTNNSFRFRTYASVSKRTTLTSAECADTHTASR